MRRKTQPTDPADMVGVETAVSVAGPVDRKTGELKPLQSSFDDRLQLALGQISPKARSCLLLRTVEGLDYKEISQLMDMPEGTAMNLVHRSKRKMRDLLMSADNAANDTPSDGGGTYE